MKYAVVCCYLKFVRFSHTLMCTQGGGVCCISISQLWLTPTMLVWWTGFAWLFMAWEPIHKWLAWKPNAEMVFTWLFMAQEPIQNGWPRSQMLNWFYMTIHSLGAIHTYMYKWLAWEQNAELMYKPRFRLSEFVHTLMYTWFSHKCPVANRAGNYHWSACATQVKSKRMQIIFN